MKYGQLSPAQIKKLGTGAKTPNILRDNHYGWFSKVSRGVYALNECAHEFLDGYPELMQHYMDMVPGSYSFDKDGKIIQGEKAEVEVTGKTTHPAY